MKHKALIVLFLAQAADMGSSLLNILRGNVEANPFLHTMPSLLLAKTLCVGLLVAIYFAVPRERVWVAGAMLFGSGVLTLVVIQNTRLLWP